MRDYIQTYLNKKVYLPDADIDSIDIIDIAHGLSHICRFNGHVNKFYSVAQHSIMVSLVLPEEHRLQGLLHDATEAYLCDIPTPFKSLMPQYKELEQNLWETIAQRFGVDVDLHPLVKEADARMLMTEKDFLKPDSDPFNEKYEAIPRYTDLSLTHMNSEYAKARFLSLFDSYTS